MSTSNDQRANPGRRLVRQRLADLPGCEDWNAAIEKAREDYQTHEPPKFCAYQNAEGEWCVNESGLRVYCAGHAAWLARCAR